MAQDTNIVCQPTRKFGRIDYGVVRQTRSLPCAAFSHVQVTRTVAVFTTDSRFCEWLLRKACRAPHSWRKASDMTFKTCSTDRTREAGIVSIKARRQIPSARS